MTELLPAASGAQTRAVVGDLLRRHRRLLVVTVLVVLGATVAGLVLPPVVGAITDTVVDGGASGRVDALALLLLAALLLRAVLTGYATALVARLGESALAGLREDVLDHALTTSQLRLEQAGSGDLVARVGEDVDDVSQATRHAVPQLVIAVLTIALTVTGLGVLDWRLALAGLAVVPIHVIATRTYLRAAGPRYAAERAAVSGRTQALGETVVGAVTARTLLLHDDRVALVRATSARALEAGLRTRRAGGVFFATLNGAELVGMTSVLIVGFFTVRSGAASIGDATAAALYFHALFNPIGALLGLLDTVMDAGASLRRLVGIALLPTPPEPAEPAAPRDAGLTLCGVHFDYGRGDVLHGIDLDLAPGERVALVGASGAGKSTIAALVAGVHTPTQGVVRLGGRTHAELGPAGVRATVALVSQEVHVFAASVAENLRLARPGATEDELAAALQTVGAEGWVAALPEGLHTVVGEGGHTLTATQAQQLALARVALAARPIVILDEATAEAGSVGAQLLERAATAVTAGATTLVVAHRLAQAATADRVVVLDNGRVTQAGTHLELLARPGAYAELWAAWSADRRTGE